MPTEEDLAQSGHDDRRPFALASADELGIEQALGRIVDDGETYGIPGALYTDRAGWAVHTPTAEAAPDRTKLTQVGRALARWSDAAGRPLRKADNAPREGIAI